MQISATASWSSGRPPTTCSKSGEHDLLHIWCTCVYRDSIHSMMLSTTSGSGVYGLAATYASAINDALSLWTWHVPMFVLHIQYAGQSGAKGCPS
jgi:hypothetical protein